jgi:hypothetical protein
MERAAWSFEDPSNYEPTKNRRAFASLGGVCAFGSTIEVNN